MSNREQIETRMRDLTNFIAQAADRVRAGEMVTLTHLDDEVASLCDQSIALPPHDALQVQPVMAEMIGTLEELARALKEYQDNKQDGTQ